MSAAIPPTPPSPGVGARRKGPKQLPRLPLSAFSPPNTGTSEQFPLPPSPSTVHPEFVIDGHISLSSDEITFDKWKQESGEILGDRTTGAVVAIDGGYVNRAIAGLEAHTGKPEILGISVPFKLGEADHPALPSTSLPLSLSTIYTGSSAENISSLRWALEQGHPVEITVRGTLSDSDLEGLEELLVKSTTDLPSLSPIIISGLLPPAYDVGLPIVKLMNHPTYQSFQAHVAALSLHANLYVNYLPPSWDGSSGASDQDTGDAGARDKKEWKRRIKMFLGPVIEAFGYQRILFGSSPPRASQGVCSVGEWYELARESLAELGVDQEYVDGVFYNNAKKVYVK
ncbi:hypothetical protein AX16_010686 [Volvariella volvacea WC 439]|nr:hypothetical protein AX16_010686 [Volvariella volvacea WC 439]